MIWDRAVRQPWLHYAAAVVLVAAAGAVHALFLQHLGRGLSYLTFYPAVMVAALSGGFRAGLLATVLSAVLVVFFWMEPVGHLFAYHPADLLGMAVFLASSVMISVITEAMHRARVRAGDAEAQAKLASERAQAVAAREENEARFRIMADSIPQLAWIARPDGQVFWRNKRWHDYTGMTPEQAEGSGWQSVHDPLMLPKVLKDRRKSIAAGQPFGMDVPLRGADGRFRQFMISVAPVKDSQGQVVQWFGTATDITDRKRAEVERETTIEFLRLVNRGGGARDMVRSVIAFFQERFGCEAVGIRLKEGDEYPYFETGGFSREFVLAENSLVVRNEAGEIVRDGEGNPVLACMCGNVICGRFDASRTFFTTRGSLRTDRAAELIAGGTAAAGRAPLRGRCAAEGYESVVLIGLRAGREQFGILQLNDRRKGFFSPETVDLWERLADYLAAVLAKVLAEEALRASLDRYRSYIEVTGQLGWTANAEGEAVDDMPSWRAYTGQTLEEIQGWGWSKALHPDELERVTRQWKTAVAEKGVYEVECRIRRHDGVYRHFLSRGVPLFKEDGSIREWVGACIDITDRKKAEEALQNAHGELESRVQERTAQVKEQARMLESFFTHGQTCVVFLDRDFNFIRVNEAYARACARTTVDFVGRNYFVDYPSDELKEKFRQVVETGQRYRVFGRPFAFPDHPEWGVSYWDLHVAPILDESGEVEFLAFSLLDVTDREEAEVALAESEERYRSIFDNSIDAILLTAPDGKVLAANPEACRIFGRTEREICAVGREEIVDMTDPKVFAFLEERARTGKARGEIIGIRKDGTGFPAELSSALFRGRDGNARNIVIVRDITEHKNDEEKIFRLNRLYSVLSKVSEAIVRIHDPEELYEQICRIAVEDGLCKMAWVGLVDPATRSINPAVSYGDTGGYLRDIGIYAADVPEGRGPTGRAASEETYCICSDIEHDDCMRPWRNRALRHGFRSLAAFPIRNGSAVIGVFTIYSGKVQFFTDEETCLLNSLAEDVSFAVQSMANEEKRRKAEDEVHRLNEELERRVRERTAQLEASNRELEAFSYSVSHDLRAPLRAIDGFSRRILEGYGNRFDEEGKRLLNVVRKNTREMGRLIDDLLAFSRLGRQKISVAEIDIGALARTVYDDMQASLPERTILFAIHTPPPALADKSLIRQVLVNLLGNAVKFTQLRNEGRIEFGGRAQGKENVYYVKDNGVGFDMRYVDKLFGIFQRMHGEEEFEGTGVGLAIVQRTVLKHGGRVWAEGKVDEGATFYFTLPT